MAKKKKNKGKGEDRPAGPRIKNRRAWRDFQILEKLECGISLLGTEVKSVRQGQAKIEESYVRIDGNELFLVGANIAHYQHASAAAQHDPARRRKLLAHRHQIEKLRSYLMQKGRTIVPLTLYFSRGRAKLEIGVAEGRRRGDKRETIRRKQQERDIQRELRRRR
jgi:SsrA-binding protein